MESFLIAQQFQWPVRVYYEDTDSAGMVYHANYLRFMERARSEWLRSLGFEQDLLLARENVIFVVRSANIEYLKPVRFNDMLSVSVVVEQSGPASITFKQQVRRFLAATSPHASHDHESLLYCSGRVKIASLDSTTLRVCPIPPSMRAKISVGDVS